MARKVLRNELLRIAHTGHFCCVESDFDEGGYWFSRYSPTGELIWDIEMDIPIMAYINSDFGYALISSTGRYKHFLIDLETGTSSVEFSIKGYVPKLDPRWLHGFCEMDEPVYYRPFEKKSQFLKMQHGELSVVDVFVLHQNSNGESIGFEKVFENGEWRYVLFKYSSEAKERILAADNWVRINYMICANHLLISYDGDALELIDLETYRIRSIPLPKSLFLEDKISMLSKSESSVPYIGGWLGDEYAFYEISIPEACMSLKRITKEDRPCYLLNGDFVINMDREVLEIDSLKKVSSF